MCTLPPIRWVAVGTTVEEIREGRATGCVQVQTTASSEEEADRVAAAVLEGRLAACVQVVGPVRSRYWWHGRLETATEWLCVAKTTDDRVEDVMAAITAAHSYDTPEVIVVGVVGGNDRYLGWVDDTVHADADTVSADDEGILDP